MKLTPYQQWLDGLMIDPSLDPMELAWIAALQWAQKRMDDNGQLTEATNETLQFGMK